MNSASGCFLGLPIRSNSFAGLAYDCAHPDAHGGPAFYDRLGSWQDLNTVYEIPQG